MGEKSSAYRNFALKPKGKRLLGRSRHRLKVIVKWMINSFGGYGLDSSG
jgi:hypothetical protein